jgi:tape measure domain-containing protein
MEDADIVIRVRSDGIKGAEAALRRLREAGVQTETVTTRMVAQTERLNRTMNGSQVIMNTMAATGMIAFLVGSTAAVVNLNDAWTSMTNKLANANTEQARMADLQGRVFEIAQRTRTDLGATATLYARMERSLASYNVTGLQVARVTETINKAMIVSGATAAEAGAAIVQLSQGLQSGVLRGDEFRSVSEQAPRLLKAMADSLHVTTGELRAMAGQGKLTSDVVTRAIYDASEAIDKEFNKTTATFSQQLAMANNNLVKFAGTSASVSSATHLLGTTVIGLSENLDTVATVAGVLAAVLVGRVVTAYGATAAASIQSAIAAAQEVGAAQALTSVKVQEAAARVTTAQATLAAANAEVVATKAAFMAEQQTYKGTSALVAHYQAKNAAAAATVELTAAQAALTTVTNTQVAAQTRLNVVMAAGRGIMGLLGGPAGVILIAAGAWYAYSQAQDRATESARNMGVETDTLTSRLKNLTIEQQKGLQVELQRAESRLKDTLREEALAIQEAEYRFNEATKATKNLTEGSFRYEQRMEAVKQLQGDVAIAVAAHSKTQQELNQVQQNAQTVTDNLRNAVTGLGTAYVYTADAALKMRTVQKQSADLTRALQAQGNEADVARLRLAGLTVQASQLQDVQNRASKVYAENKKFVDDYIAGHIDAAAAVTEDQKGLVKFLDMSKQAAEAQEKLAQQRKDDRAEIRQNRAAERYQDQWDKAYEKAEARGLTAVDRLRSQQAAEEAQMRKKAERAGATEEQLQKALTAIQVKYDREREQLAGEYNPALKMKTAYEEANNTIRQLQEAGLLDLQAANQARLEAEGNYLQQRLQLLRDQAVTEREEIAGMYNPAQEAQNEYDRELAALQAARDAQLVTEEDFLDKRHELYTKMYQQQAKYQSRELLSFASSAGDMAGALATTLEAMGKKNSNAYKVAFAASKAFAIADASVKVAAAVAQALADPTALTPLQKFANMAAVAAAGANLVQQVTSVGMAHDGIDNIPKEGTWLLDKGERVVDRRTNADLKEFLSNNSGGASSSTIYLTQYFQITGSGDAALRAAVEEAAEQGATRAVSRVHEDAQNNGPIYQTIRS